MLMSSSVMMFVLATVIDRPWQLQMPGPATWLAILGLASLSTALAFIIFFQIAIRSGASNVMLVTLLVPVSAILLGYFFLDERIEFREIVGALIIGSALLVMDGRVIDEGACFELGYAYSRGKVCIGLKTDVRSLLPIGDNPMVECALRGTFGDIFEVGEWIRSRRWEHH